MPYYPPRYLFRRHALLRVLRPGESFIEIGPGSLLLAQELLNHFSRGTLIEYSEDVQTLYNALPAWAQARLELRVVDFMKHELARQHDCVVACEVMEHIVDDEAFLHKLFSSLHEGGQVILSVPALMKFWSTHDDIVGHIRRYEKAALFALMHKAGFVGVHIDAYGFPFVNWLRLPRIWLARRQYQSRSALSTVEQTKWSGINQTIQLPSLAGWLINPATVYPLAQLSTLFHGADWSGAYLVSGFKPGRHVPKHEAQTPE